MSVVNLGPRATPSEQLSSFISRGRFTLCPSLAIRFGLRVNIPARLWDHEHDQLPPPGRLCQPSGQLSCPSRSSQLLQLPEMWAQTLSLPFTSNLLQNLASVLWSLQDHFHVADVSAIIINDLPRRCNIYRGSTITTTGHVFHHCECRQTFFLPPAYLFLQRLKSHVSSRNSTRSASPVIYSTYAPCSAAAIICVRAWSRSYSYTI